MKNVKWLWVSVMLCMLLLTACGGGGSSPVGASGTSKGTSPFNPTPAGPVAAALDITSSAVQLGNTASAKVTITVTALDSGKRAVAGTDVLIAVAAGSDAVVTQAATTTDAQGKVIADVSVGSNKANRAVTITATSGFLVKSTTLQVTGAKITSTLSAAVLPPSPDAAGSGTVRYRVVDQANNPMPGQAVNISATAYDPPSATGMTDVNGEYLYSFKTPSSSGSFVIDAVVAGASNQTSVNVQSAGSVADVTQDIVSVALTASPSVVPVNVTGTQNRSEIRAIFLGDANVPIKNVRVKFYLDDAFGVGGSFTSNAGTRPLYTDASGIITTSYIPSARPSPTEGVVVRVCYGKTDADLANFGCPFTKIVTLTVIDDPLGVTIGTDGLIEINTARLTYVKKYVVQVVDSAGNPKADINLSAVVDLPRYYKGSYSVGADSWVSDITEQCNSEDSNRNNSIDFGEDIDNDNRLDPGKSDVQVRLIESKTGIDGLAILQIEYPQNYGSWVAARVTVAASGILGTEGRATFLDDPVPVPATVVKNIEVAPPFVVSPYGFSAGTVTTGGPCTNPE
jgi:hypothetical protein